MYPKIITTTHDNQPTSKLSFKHQLCFCQYVPVNKKERHCTYLENHTNKKGIIEVSTHKCIDAFTYHPQLQNLLDCICNRV